MCEPSVAQDILTLVGPRSGRVWPLGLWRCASPAWPGIWTSPSQWAGSQAATPAAPSSAPPAPGPIGNEKNNYVLISVLRIRIRMVKVGSGSVWREMNPDLDPGHI